MKLLKNLKMNKDEKHQVRIVLMSILFGVYFCVY